MPNTNRRLRRRAALLMAKQSAKGVDQTVFSFSGDSIRLWPTSCDIPAGRGKAPPGPWMDQLQTESASGRWTKPEHAEGHIEGVLTPATADLLLRSNWGLKSGASYILSPQVSEWFSLAWLESKSGAPDQNVVRLVDTFVRRLAIRSNRAEGVCYFSGNFSSRRQPTSAQSTAGLTLPAPPMTITDRRLFPVRLAQFRLDPVGANVNIAYVSCEIVLDQVEISEWSMGNDAWNVDKGGKTHATIELEGVASNETWQILTDSTAGTKRTFRFVATSEVSPAVLIIDLHNVDFEVRPLGMDSQGYHRFTASGRALRSGSTFADISLT